MGHNFEDGVLERLCNTLGVKLLEFTVNADAETLTSGTLTEKQRSYVLELDAGQNILIDKHQLDSNQAKEVLRGHLTDTSQSSQPLALAAHVDCGGLILLPKATGELEAAIVELALDVYPTFLLPPDEFEAQTGTPSFHVYAGLFRHPANRRFQEAALSDSILSKIFDKDDPHTGRSVMVNRSTFQGHAVQLSTLAGFATQAVWRDHLSEAPLALNDFVAKSLEKWRFIQAALAGKRQYIRTRVAFAGVLLPEGSPIDFGNAVIREVTYFERSLAPEAIKGQLNGTDAEGNTVTINYDGDLVAEINQPYFVKIDKRPIGDPFEGFSPELTAENPVEDMIMRLRLSLVLGVKRQHRVQIISTWLAYDDPLNNGHGIGWNDSRRVVGLMPTKLTKNEVESWSRCYKLLVNPKVDKLGLAISRVVRAIGERQDPVDVLIDSVVAWENLFGSKEGEPTLRVTASLALLLEDDYAERRKLRTRLTKIYTLRSDAVHGTGLPSNEQIALCYEALDIAIRALQIILERRSDLLDEPDSTSRSLRIILGAPALESAGGET